jgi:hypothetical protein
MTGMTATPSTDWWDEVTARPKTPLRELIDDFDTIAAQAIPYSGIRGRARTFYGSDFVTWSDIADQTLASLINRPNGGERTVRAIVAAARDAVLVARQSVGSGHGGNPASAVCALLDRLAQRDRMLLSSRVCAVRPVTARQTAQRLGVHTIWVHRNQPRAAARLAELLAEPAHSDVGVYAEQLGRRLGSLTREHIAYRALRNLGLDPDTEAGQLLLHVAGPYGWRDGWVELRPEGLRTASQTLEAVLARVGAPSNDDLSCELVKVGLAPDAIADFVESWPGLRRFGDQWVRWGPSAADKVEAVLHLIGAPSSPDHERGVKEALYVDRRFTRATKQTWALRAWGLAEYHGLFSEIAERIDAAGGTVTVADMIRDMKAAFPDVAESSIRTYLGAPGFKIEGGAVRRRTDADGWRGVAPLRTVRGAYHNGRNEIRLALPVTDELLRGSGQTIPPAVAAALRVSPGDQKTFTGKIGDLTITWRLSATNGAAAGSLRELANKLGASRGDTLVLVFGLRDESIGIVHINQGEDARRRLRMLLGRPVNDPAAALARGLRCGTADLAKLLRRRGENDLLTLLQESPPLTDEGALDARAAEALLDAARVE